MKKEFTRVRSALDWTISLILLIAGCVTVAIPTPAAVNIAAIFVIFAGILLIVVLRSAWKDKETGEKYHKKEFYFPQSCRDRIIKAVSDDIGSIDMQEEDKGNGLRLDLFYNKHTGKAYLQVFEYIPYRYEPATEFFEQPVSKIGKLLK